MGEDPPPQCVRVLRQPLCARRCGRCIKMELFSAAMRHFEKEQHNELTILLRLLVDGDSYPIVAKFTLRELTSYYIALSTIR